MFDFWVDDARALTWTTNVLVKSESLGLGGIRREAKNFPAFLLGSATRMALVGIGWVTGFALP